MNTTQARVLIMAGGTGGHIYPALTIARELAARGAEVQWLGTRAGLEARVVAATSFPLHFISIGGLRGKGVLRLITAPFAIVRAIFQALRTISRLKPGCVLGMGGFVTGPGGVAARLLGRPLIIHEQNAIAGLSNQLLCPLAGRVLEAFPGAFARKQSGSRLPRRLVNPAKIEVVGNPVRQEILALPAAAEHFAGRSGRLRLLVIGGSLGAVAINRLMPQLMNAMAGDDRPELRHQCGARNLDTTLAAYREQGIEPDADLQVLPFIEDMAQAYRWADVIICRAGASTVAEIAVAGLPAVLVPYPWAVDDHQTANAGMLEQAGAGWVIQQDALTVDALTAILGPLAADRSRLLQHAQAAQAVAIRDASTRAADYCLEACNA